MKKYTILLGFFGVLTSTLLLNCVSVQQRDPSGKMDGKLGVVFNLNYDRDLIKQRYHFELIDLAELQKAKLSFKKHGIRERDSREDVARWVEQLKKMASDLDKKIEFTADLVPISIKKSDLTKLVNVLELTAATGEDPEVILRKQVEIITAFNNSCKSPLEQNGKIEITTFIFSMLKRLGDYTIREAKSGEPLQVASSSFWTDRSKEKIDMAVGSGSSKMPNVIERFQQLLTASSEQQDAEACNYAGPKKGYGTNLGFKVKCFGYDFKVKLAEYKAAPFNSKIYHRLGYNVPAIYFIDRLEMKYDRKLFTEIESRKDQYIRVALLGINVKKFKVKKNSNILNRVTYGILKNGQKLSGEELFQNLLPNCKDTKCHLSDDQYNIEFENNISRIAFENLAITEENGDHDFGPWAFDELDHKNRVEVNALALVGAFTANVDLRKDNTRLRWSARTGEIQHAISDPGLGIGKGTPFKGFNINLFRWNVIHQYDVADSDFEEGGNKEKRKAIGINGFKPSSDHKAFRRLDTAEARWIARQIASISEDELTEALVTSGFSVGEMLLAREKLVSIQKNIAETLGLLNEFPKLANRVINRQISYQPSNQDYVVNLENGRSYKVREKGYSIINGVLHNPSPNWIIKPTDTEPDSDELIEEPM